MYTHKGVHILSVKLYLIFFIFKFDAKHSLHALLEHRVASGFADDDIGPLHHHDADEERRVAGELHDLALLVGLKGGVEGRRERRRTMRNI